ncbi:hypothetical protein J3F84DRAFT_354657 [Trichoderma pleuroticola]
MAYRKHLTTDPCNRAMYVGHRARHNTQLRKRVCSGSSTRIQRSGGHGGPSLFESKVKAQAIEVAAHHTIRREVERRQKAGGIMVVVVATVTVTAQARWRKY